VVSPPSTDSVRDGRFIVPVGLDKGALMVEPAPANVTPSLFTQQQAEARIWASPTVVGPRSGAVMGFGLVTVNEPSIGASLLRPIQGGPTPERMPAWIGFAWGGGPRCVDTPAVTVTPPPTSGTVTPPPTSGYEAVVIPTDGTVSAFTYSARTSYCGLPATAHWIAKARYVVSIPWTSDGKVKNGRVTMEYTPPACGVEVGAGGADGGSSDLMTLSVHYSVPTNPVPVPPCPSPSPVSKTVRVVFGSDPGGKIVFLHGKTGIIRQIQLGQ